VPENMAYMRELRAFCATHEPPPVVEVDFGEVLPAYDAS